VLNFNTLQNNVFARVNKNGLIAEDTIVKTMLTLIYVEKYSHACQKNCFCLSSNRKNFSKRAIKGETY